MSNAGTEHRRLLWKCRRGLRETGVLLEDFMRHRYDALTPRERRCLAVLLEYPEPELLACIVGEQAAPDATTAQLLQRIRAGSK